MMERQQSPIDAHQARPLVNAGREEKGRAIFWLLCTYFVFEYGRIHDVVPFLNLLRIPMLLSISLILVWLLRGDKAVLTDPLVKLYISFLSLMALGVFFAENRFWVFENTKWLTIFLFAAVLPVATFIQSPRQFGQFTRLWVVIHVFVAATSITRGGVGTSSFLADENDLSLVLNMALPYAFFLSQSPRVTKIMKILLLCAALVLVIAVIKSFSRGGFVGLVATVAAILFYSRNRVRNTILLALLGLLIVSTFVPDSYISEMETIQDPKQSTAADRLHSWAMGWEMFLDNPVLGVGAGNWGYNVEAYELRQPDYDADAMKLHGGRWAHSLYFTLIPELGAVGTIIYSMIVLGVFQRLRRLTRMQYNGQLLVPEALECIHIARAMVASLVAFLASGAFISVLYYPHFWYLVGFVLALERTMNGIGQQPPSGPSAP